MVNPLQFKLLSKQVECPGLIELFQEQLPLIFFIIFMQHTTHYSIYLPTFMCAHIRELSCTSPINCIIWKSAPESRGGQPSGMAWNVVVESRGRSNHQGTSAHVWHFWAIGAGQETGTDTETDTHVAETDTGLLPAPSTAPSSLSPAFRLSPQALPPIGGGINHLVLQQLFFSVLQPSANRSWPQHQYCVSSASSKVPKQHSCNTWHQ